MKGIFNCNFKVYKVELIQGYGRDYIQRVDWQEPAREIFHQIPHLNLTNYKPLIEPAIVREYDPFDNYNNQDFGDLSNRLYLHFASINQSKPEDILAFISDYGFLGIRDYEQLAVRGSTPISKSSESDFQTENLDDIAFQIARMRYLINLAHRTSKATVDDLYLLILNAYMFNDNDAFRLGEDLIGLTSSLEESNLLLKNNYLFIRLDNNYKGVCDITYFKELYREFFGEDLHVLKQVADSIILRILNKEIMNLIPFIAPSPSKDKQFYPKWQTSTLLSALYAMFYFDLTANKLIRKCANSGCNNYFDPSQRRFDTKYCEDACGKAVASRKYRAEVKAKREELLKCKV